MADLLIIGVLAAAIAIGVFLYATVGGASHTLSDSMALISSIFYIAAGIALIIGGFMILGVLLIVLFVFIGLGKADRLSDTDIRGRING